MAETTNDVLRRQAHYREQYPQFFDQHDRKVQESAPIMCIDCGNKGRKNEALKEGVCALCGGTNIRPIKLESKVPNKKNRLREEDASVDPESAAPGIETVDSDPGGPKHNDLPDTGMEAIQREVSKLLGEDGAYMDPNDDPMHVANGDDIDGPPFDEPEDEADPEPASKPPVAVQHVHVHGDGDPADGAHDDDFDEIPTERREARQRPRPRQESRRRVAEAGDPLGGPRLDGDEDPMHDDDDYDEQMAEAKVMARRLRPIFERMVLKRFAATLREMEEEWPPPDKDKDADKDDDTDHDNPFA